MTHNDMLDAATYAIGVRNRKIYPRTLDNWTADYFSQWRIDDDVETVGIADKWPKESPYRLYVEQDLISTQELHNILNKEKESEPMTTNREKMNSLKKGMLVECYIDHRRGYIEAFDYTHMRVGIRVEGSPSYKNLTWFSPNFLAVITTPDGNAAQTLNGPCPKPKRVVYDEEAGITVVLWEDGQKTIVRATEGEQMDVYDAFCAAYCKRVYGTNSALKRELNKILTVNHPKEPEPEHITMTESFQKLNDGIKKLKDALDGKSND